MLENGRGKLQSNFFIAEAIAKYLDLNWTKVEVNKRNIFLFSLLSILFKNVFDIYSGLFLFV